MPCFIVAELSRAELPPERPREFIKGDQLISPDPMSANRITYSHQLFLTAAAPWLQFHSSAKMPKPNKRVSNNKRFIAPRKRREFHRLTAISYISFIIFYRATSEDAHCRLRRFIWTFQRLLGRASSLGMSGILFNRPRILSCSRIVLPHKSKGGISVSEANEKNSVPV